ncbi:tripartite tricarboxylate transporter substrate binding protein [Roseomonas sp. ACRSG]|nr:tripartite tricarboxylate transporter substrate binding protein [Roseomonas sp. ACRSG]
MITRRQGLIAGLAPAFLGAGRARAQASAWPAQNIRLVVPFAAGGALDIMARLFAEKMRPLLGRTVVVENVTGAGTVIATEQVARAAPDGYTLLVASSAHTINPAIQARIRYDPIKDFTFVTLLATPLHVLVVPDKLPVRSVAELIALAKAKPGSMTYASVGYGTSTHLEAEMFARMAGIQIEHVPYRGSAPALTDLVAGRVPVMFDALASSGPYMEAKTIRALGQTGARRSPLIPDLPTLAEAGLPGYEAMPWTGIMGPAGLDQEIVERLDTAFRTILADPAVQARFASLGLETLDYRPERFTEFVRSDLAKWTRIANEANIRASD